MEMTDIERENILRKNEKKLNMPINIYWQKIGEKEEEEEDKEISLSVHIAAWFSRCLRVAVKLEIFSQLINW